MKSVFAFVAVLCLFVGMILIIESGSWLAIFGFLFSILGLTILAILIAMDEVTFVEKEREALE